MKIVMFTNTYEPHVGGVARSVATLRKMLLDQGHRVHVVAPEFPGAEKSTAHVFRVPALQNFNGSDFSVCLSMPHLIDRIIDSLEPDLIHSHHPFLLGDAALRVARRRDLPLVFTHHTMYEHYTHYVPLDSQALKRLAIQLATDYCNLCDAVIAPSESVEELLRKRGVTTTLRAIPTGIDLQAFAQGRRGRFRRRFDLAESAFVVGHVGRLAAEKNLGFLAQALAEIVAKDSGIDVVIVGDGSYREEMEARLNRSKESGGRVRFTGKLTGQDLFDAYAAMDLFVMASQSETQGMVVAEAMAAGNPVVALDGPGIREVVVTGRNGDLLPADASPARFAGAVLELKGREGDWDEVRKGALRSARDFDQRRCGARVAELYGDLARERAGDAGQDLSQWDRMLGRVNAEWNLFVEKCNAVRATMADTDATEAKLD